MSIFRKAVDRPADLLRRNGKVTYRVSINARIAAHVTPLLDKLVADDEDGDTLRASLIPWQRAERPPIAAYCGDLSFCRIDGPWQVAGEHWLPLGGLILSRGVTALLNPFEAQALHKRMQQTIENAILAWVREHDLYAVPRVPEEVDRTVADPAAKAMIAAWAFGKREGDAMSGTNPDQPGDCCSGEPGDSLCAACRKGLGNA